MNIGCIVLNNVEWLNEESYFPTNDSLFHPKINAFKYFKHGSFPELEARFLSTSDLSIPDVAGIVSVPLPPKVDMPLSTHDDEQWKTPPAIDIELPVGGPTRVMVHDYRILRDTAIAAKAKNIYNYRCQICPAILQAPSGARYAESHHIKPIGFPHNGPDILENVLCLCPNCHAQLDYGIIPIDVRRLNIHTSHQIHKDFILYHNQEIYGKVIWR